MIFIKLVTSTNAMSVNKKISDTDNPICQVSENISLIIINNKIINFILK